MKRNLHTTPEQIRTQNSDILIEVINRSTIKSEENTREVIQAIKDDGKYETILGFTGVVKALHQNTDVLHDIKNISSQLALIQKLEEIKSAILASNITLKKIDKKESPTFEQKEADFSKTNELLTTLIAEIKKPENVKITLKLI